MFYSTDPDDRAAFIASLRMLADFLAASPAVPVPVHGADISLHADYYEDGGKAQVDRFAYQSGAAITDHTPDGHYTADRLFGQISYRIVAIPGTAMALRAARHSYDDSIILDTNTENTHAR